MSQSVHKPWLSMLATHERLCSVFTLPTEYIENHESFEKKLRKLPMRPDPYVFVVTQLGCCATVLFYLNFKQTICLLFYIAPTKPRAYKQITVDNFNHTNICII